MLFGERAAITAGVVLGQVRTLPAGLALNDVVEDANLLPNLGDRGATSFFLGVSYAFLGGGRDDLRKPFLGAEPSAGAESLVGTRDPLVGAGFEVAVQGAASRTGATENLLSDPLAVRLTRRRVPVGGVTVVWRVEGPSGVASVGPTSSTTNEQGIARTQVTTGAPAGTVQVLAVPCTSERLDLCVPVEKAPKFSITVR